MNIEERLQRLDKPNRSVRRGPVGLLLLALVAVAFVVLLVLGGNKDQPDPHTPIPKDDRFSIISDVGQPPQKRTVDVRLLRSLSEEELSTIAYKIKASDTRSYERTFITYYLPGMAVGAGGWATTHFGLFDSPQVRIFAFTEMDKARAWKKANQPSDQVIGRWLDRGSFMGPITIYKKDGKLYLEQQFKDGSQTKKEMVESTSSLGRRFDRKNGSSHGDHFIIQADGHLQLRDREGLIRVARKTGN